MLAEAAKGGYGMTPDQMRADLAGQQVPPELAARLRAAEIPPHDPMSNTLPPYAQGLGGAAPPPTAQPLMPASDARFAEAGPPPPSLQPAPPRMPEATVDPLTAVIEDFLATTLQERGQMQRERPQQVPDLETTPVSGEGYSFFPPPSPDPSDEDILAQLAAPRGISRQ
jgi:hypothetical protein